MTTPKEERDIQEAIEEAQRQNRIGVSLEDSAIGLAKLYVRIKEIGVDKEFILDIIRLPMMFSAMPDKPEQVTDTLADIDKVDRSN